MSNDSDTSIDIPEVTYEAVRAHCKKLELQGFVTCVEENLIEGM
jgi:hypothetical protein